MEPNYGDNLEPIAVIGMACRFAGDASSIEKFWKMMNSGAHGASPIPEDRFNADAWYHPNHERRGAIQTRRGFFLKEDISLFDATFFSMTAKEVSGIDPMQRQLLEIAYEAFENAGIPLENLIGSDTAVYTGVMTNDYELISATDIYDLPLNSASGTGRAMLSNRLSWFFDLRGPSLTLDTACSSSLYAVHLACQALRLSEASQALVTGVNLILHPSLVSQLSSMHMLSVDGVSHSFDSSANGYGRGEGVGGIVIKPLRAALADGDTIRAVIRGSGINQDGKTPGITMPSEQAQAALINSTYAAAGLNFKDTSYFEAHGTGTALGDLVELSAVAATLGNARREDSVPLYVGSVKTNIGHTEGMSGLAGIIKTILCLEKGTITPVVGFKKLNPQLRLTEWHMALPLEAMAWPNRGLRRASVNSFGFGGANAHMILDDAFHYLQSRGLSGNHETAAVECSSDPSSTAGHIVNGYSSQEQLFVFSSHDKAGLERIAKSYSNFFLSEDRDIHSIRLDFLSHTLSSRRSHFDFRSFAVSSSHSDLARSLEHGLPKFHRISKHGNVVLVFTGQGAQWVGMGRELVSNAAYRFSVLRSQGFLQLFGCEWDLLEIFSGNSVASFNRPILSQPLCTILQIALVDLLFHWGLVPGAVVGHSSGEIVAAYAAGAITHKDAVKVAYYRGVYSEDIPKRLKSFEGTMMAAGISEDEALGYLDRECAHNEVVIGCINSPSNVTFSGESKAIDRLQLILQGDGKFARRLRVDVAYHSPQMQVAAEDFLQAIGEISTASEFRVPMFSSVTTKLVPHPRDLNASYWVGNMLGSVRFAEAVKNLLSSPAPSQRGGGKPRPKKHWSAILEVGPADALKGPLNQIVAAFDRKLSTNIMYTSMLQRGKSASTTAMEAVGRLWCIGHSIDLGKVNNAKEDALKPKALAMLPPYPWNHKMSFWHEPKASQLARLGRYPRTDLLGVPSDNQNPFEPRWRNFLRIPENPWLKDHIITGTCLYPGAGIFIMVLEAACQLVDPKTIAGVGFEDVFFERGLVIPAEKDAVETALSIKPHESLQSCYQFTLFSIPLGGEWTKHAHGMFSLVPHSANEVDAAASRTEWELIKSRYHDLSHLPSKSIDSASFYRGLKAVGLDYGPLFANLGDIEAVHGVQCALGSVTIPDTSSIMPFQFEYPHYIHPATLDAMFHLVFVALSGHPGMAEAAIPVCIDQAFISTSLPCGTGAKYVGFSHATTPSKSIAADLIFSDEEWTEAKVTFRGIQLHNVSSDASNSGETVARSGQQSVSRTAQIQWLEDTDCLRGPSAAVIIEAEAYVPWKNGLNVGAETGREVEVLLPTMAEACEQLAAWLRRLCHKHSDLNVLLIGVNSKEGILRRFAPYEDDNKGSFRFERCTALDNCERALSRVKEALAAEGIICTYSSLTGSVASYDSPLNSYDLIIADIDLVSLDDEILSTLRPLLRKDGRLALQGPSPTSQLDPQTWEAKLRNADFNGLLFHIQNKETAFLVTAIDEKGGNSIDITEVHLLQPAVISSAIQDLKFNLLQQFKLVGITAKDALLAQASSLKGRVVISLLETERPFVMAWTAEELDQFRTVVASAKYLLWISRGGLLNSDLKSLQFAPTIGLLRTIRVEQSSTTLPHLDLTQELDAGRAASLIYEVFQSTIMAPPPSKNNEMEYLERNGALFIPRLTKRSDLDYDLALLSNSAKTVIAPLKVDSQNLQLRHDLTDSQCSFRWSADKEAIEGIGDYDVVICPTFVSLDVPELRISSASHGTPFDTLVGRIIELGSKVSGLQLGESVITFHPSTVKTRLSIHRSRICQLPGSWSPPVATYVSLSLATAWHVLFHVARFNRGDHILIQVNSKPLCHFLVQLAQYLGAIVFLVVDSEEERILWQELKGILASRIFNSQSSILGQPILRATGNIGVKIFITTCCGPALNDLASCIAEDGHLIDLGRKIQVKDLSRTFFTRNITISCVDLSRMIDRTLYDLLGEGLDYVRARHLHGPPKPTITSIAELNNVFQSARRGNQSDNLVLSFNEGAMVPMLHTLPPALALNPNGTYVLSGGLGALGLVIANHLVNHGARHLLFLSRSGAVTSEQKDALRNFRDRGCKVDSVKCDIANANQMKKAALACKENHWRITGIIQCAMVLRDTIFENMTIEKWRGAADPKIQGSWNLHLHIPSDHLEFFIILSSMSAIIGNSAQANYCAGNSYADALAHYRYNLGLPATTLNVGLVTNASHFHAENTIEDYLRKFGHLAPISVTLDELLISLSAAMAGHTVNGQPIPPQLLVGVSDRIQRHGDLHYLWPKDRKFDHRLRESDPNDEFRGLELEASLRASKSVSEALAVVEDSLRKSVAASITALPEDIDVGRPLHSFGVDSLKAMEVRNWIEHEFKCNVSVFDIISPMPLTELALQIVRKSLIIPTTIAQQANEFNIE